MTQGRKSRLLLHNPNSEDSVMETPRTKAFNFDPDEDDEKLSTPQNIAAVLFFIACLFINCTFQVLTEKRVANAPGSTQKSSLILDIGHDISASIMGQKSIFTAHDCDLFLIAITVLTFARFSFSRSRIAAFRRISIVLGVMYFFRGPAIYMTVLPNQEDECIFNPSQSVILDVFAVLTRMKVTCADQFYSGHTAMMVAFLMLFTTHTSSTSFSFVKAPLRVPLYVLSLVVMWGIGVVGWSVIILSRFHYSIDVYIGGLVSVFVFWGYYDVFRLGKRGYQFRKVHLSLSQRTIFWLEAIEVADDADK